jgi:hypothetical protein
MKRETGWRTIVAVFILALVASSADAWWGPRRARHADRNRDGVVTPREAVTERRWEWHPRATVNTPAEARADRDRDGAVEPREAARAATVRYLRRRSDVDRPWEIQADVNSDGAVDVVELRRYHRAKMDGNGDGVIGPAERRLYWTQCRAVVNTPVEKKYDADGNGYLNWDEAREMLKDKLRVIETGGRAVVNTDIETEFDADGDGIISVKEAEAIRAALAAG